MRFSYFTCYCKKLKAYSCFTTQTRSIQVHVSLNLQNQVVSLNLKPLFIKDHPPFAVSLWRNWKMVRNINIISISLPPAEWNKNIWSFNVYLTVSYCTLMLLSLFSEWQFKENHVSIVARYVLFLQFVLVLGIVKYEGIVKISLALERWAPIYSFYASLTSFCLHC